jgi:hypothetical protein
MDNTIALYFFGVPVPREIIDRMRNEGPDLETRFLEVMAGTKRPEKPESNTKKALDAYAQKLAAFHEQADILGLSLEQVGFDEDPFWFLVDTATVVFATVDEPSNARQCSYSCATASRFGTAFNRLQMKGATPKWTLALATDARKEVDNGNDE